MKYSIPLWTLLFLFYLQLVAEPLKLSSEWAFAFSYLVLAIFLEKHETFPKLDCNSPLGYIIYQTVFRIHKAFKSFVYFVFLTLFLIFLVDLFIIWNHCSENFFSRLFYTLLLNGSRLLGVLADAFAYRYFNLPNMPPRLRAVNSIIYWTTAITCVVWLLESYFSDVKPEEDFFDYYSD